MELTEKLERFAELERRTAVLHEAIEVVQEHASYQSFQRFEEDTSAILWMLAREQNQIVDEILKTESEKQ